MDFALVAVFGLLVLAGGIGLYLNSTSNQRKEKLEKRLMSLPPAERARLLDKYEKK
jgi:hypothetical protein